MKTILIAILIEGLVNALSVAGIYFLWNAMMPDLIMAKEITVFQSLMLRCLVLFCVGRSVSVKRE
jgi:hypothetical protein